MRYLIARDTFRGDTGNYLIPPATLMPMAWVSTNCPTRVDQTLRVYETLALLAQGNHWGWYPLESLRWVVNAGA